MSSSSPRENSAEAIAPSIPTLLSLTKDNNAQLRENVFRTLGFLRPKVPPQVVAAMHESVRDPDPSARSMAILAIARSFAKGSNDEKLLKELLLDPQSLIRKTAVEAVGIAMRRKPSGSRCRQDTSTVHTIPMRA